MGYQALLFCADEKAVRGLTQVLNELDFSVEACSEPFAAVKQLTAQHFDALIVDCDDEQSATLLLKTARNSETNSASLSVAVVQGQAAIAKAFRIGANLVLTKPINVEQSKGTLRVARGLLRKAEAGKATAPTETPQPADIAAETGQTAFVAAADETPTPVLAPATLISSVPMVSSALEAEPEPTPQPDAAEVALLESMPPPMLAKAAAVADNPFISTAPMSVPESGPKPKVTANANAERPVRGVGDATPASGRPEVSQIRMAVAEVKESRRADRLGSNSDASAAAVAPAREMAPPVASSWAPTAAPSKPAEPKPSELKPAEPKAELKAELKKEAQKPSPVAAKKSTNQAASKKVTADFSWLDAARDQETSGGPNSKRNFVIAAVLVLGLAVGGYYGWPRLEPTLMSLPVVQKYLGPVPAPALAPAASPAPAQTASASGTGTAQDQTSATEANGAAVPPSDPSSGAGAMNSDTGPVPPSSPAATTAIATNGANTESSAPSTSAGASQGAAGSTVAALASTLTAAALKPAQQPAQQPLRVPQTISEGLLLKRTEPLYPNRARHSGVAGKVQLQADVAQDGSVTQVKALSGDPMLVRSAMEAVRQWKYKPYSLNGQPVEFETEITVNFKLPD